MKLNTTICETYCPNCQTYNNGFFIDDSATIKCKQCRATLKLTKVSRRHTVIHLYEPEHIAYYSAL